MTSQTIGSSRPAPSVSGSTRHGRLRAAAGIAAVAALLAAGGYLATETVGPDAASPPRANTEVHTGAQKLRELRESITGQYGSRPAASPVLIQRPDAARAEPEHHRPVPQPSRAGRRGAPERPSATRAARGRRRPVRPGSLTQLDATEQPRREADGVAGQQLGDLTTTAPLRRGSSDATRMHGVREEPPEEMPGEEATTGTRRCPLPRLQTSATALEHDSRAPAMDDERASGSAPPRFRDSRRVSRKGVSAAGPRGRGSGAHGGPIEPPSCNPEAGAAADAQAVASWCRWSLRRLWVAVNSRHSDLTADLPRRWKRSAPRLLLIWPKTGSTVPCRLR